MSKVCVHINKIKSMGTLKSRWNHDLNEQFRKEHVNNADSDRYKDNDILYSCTDERGFAISYDKAVKNRITGLRQSDGRKIRENQVLAYDVVLEFGDSDDIEAEGLDVEEWEKRSLEWLKETFNVAGDGKENVLSVVCHKDESSPHIHAIITPVDERGHLCAKSFTDGSAALSHLQTTYAEKLKDLGIERGIPGSSAHHKPNRRYNAEKEKAAKLPEPKPNESAIDYLSRYQLELEQRAIDQKIKMDKLERNLRASIDKERYEQQKAINSEIDTIKVYYENEKDKLNDELEDLKKEYAEVTSRLVVFTDEKNRLKSEIDSLKQDIYNIDDLKIKAEMYDEQNNMMKYLNNHNHNLYNQIFDLNEQGKSEYMDYIHNENDYSKDEQEYQDI